MTENPSLWRRLGRLLSPDTPWRRAAEIAAIVAALITVGALLASLVTGNGSEEGGGGGKSGGPSLTPAPSPSESSVTTSPPPALSASILCPDGECVTRDGQLRIEAKLTGSIPPDSEVSFLIFSVGDNAWFITSPIEFDEDGKWRVTKTLGNPSPHPREREFNLCLYLLRTADAEELKAKDRGFAATELPATKQRLDCVAARRPGKD